jgi:hypothetical protein
MAMVIALIALVGVGTASAAQFRAEESWVTVNGTQGVKQNFGAGGASISCTASSVTGTLASASTSLWVAAAFSGCEISSPVSSSATAKTNGCTFMYHNSSEPYENNGNMDLLCGSSSLEFSGGGCTIKYPGNQTGRGNVKYINTGGASRNHTITVSYEVNNLTYSVSGLFCILKAGTFENGTLTGTSVLKGSKEGHAVGMYLFNEPFEFHPTFNTEQFPLSVEASSQGRLGIKTAAGENACNFQGVTNVSEPTGVLALNGEFTSCFPGPEEIKMNGCTLTLEPKVSEGTVAEGLVGVACPEGKSISWKWWTCSTTIGPQSGVGSVSFEGSGSGSSRVVTASIFATKLKYTELAGCASPGLHEDMQLNGTLKVAGIGKGIWIN